MSNDPTQTDNNSTITTLDNYNSFEAIDQEGDRAFHIILICAICLSWTIIMVALLPIIMSIKENF